MNPVDTALLERLWTDLDGPPEVLSSVSLSGPMHLLPSVYDVSSLATATIGLATIAIAELHAVRNGDEQRAVHIDRAHAAVAFRSERYLSPLGWEIRPPWDPIAGDYRTADGWIRLHTNYSYHRDAALRVLGATISREDVAAAVRVWAAEDLELAVVREGGCAARLRTASQWAVHPQGDAVAREPLFAIATRHSPMPLRAGRADWPLAGIRVLDLTRVIAGPICTRVLAAYGAQVLRIDPPGFQEVGALLTETTGGKRRAFLNLRDQQDRTRLQELIAEAQVVVHGYRPDALERLGIGLARRREINPSLIDASLDAYGWTGPWANRRGFDSLVQMSTGIAERGLQAARADKPVPLPAQALDHGCGYLLAAAVCRALVRLIVDHQASDIRVSLARIAKLLVDLGDGGDITGPELGASEVARCSEEAMSSFGPIRRVRCPGSIDGIDPRWAIAPGPLGVDAPVWL